MRATIPVCTRPRGSAAATMRAGLLAVRPPARLAGGRVRVRDGAISPPMHYPSMECSTSPFQVFSLSWSRNVRGREKATWPLTRNHSAIPRSTRLTRTVVALTLAT